jgi:hypothetical protein
MKFLICFALTSLSLSAFAQQSEFQRRDHEDMEQFSQRLHDIDERNYKMVSEDIGSKLATLNYTTVTFDPNVHMESKYIGSDQYMQGEWVLGNGGVCVLGEDTEYVYCNGAQGFSYKKPGAQ